MLLPDSGRLRDAEANMILQHSQQNYRGDNNSMLAQLFQPDLGL